MRSRAGARLEAHNSTGASRDFDASERVTATPSEIICPTTAPSSLRMISYLQREDARRDEGEASGLVSVAWRGVRLCAGSKEE